jgi:hypothetical protein
MYVNARLVRYLERECITSTRTTDAKHYLMPPESLAGRQSIITVRDADVKRSIYIDRANALTN